MCIQIDRELGAVLNRDRNSPNIGEWVGGFFSDQDPTPQFVIQLGRAWKPDSIASPECLRTLPPKYPVYLVGDQSRSLIPDQSEALHFAAKRWTGLLRLVRVVEVGKVRKGGSLAYYGIVGKLHFDPGLWKWRTNIPLMMYSAKAEKEILVGRKQLKTPILEKWRHELNVNFQIDWKKL